MRKIEIVCGKCKKRILSGSIGGAGNDRIVKVKCLTCEKRELEVEKRK
jgi:hypothetical protein